MVSREELLQAAEDEDTDKLIKIVQLHNSTSDTFDLGELLVTLDKALQDELWGHLQLKCTTSLLGIYYDGDEEEQIQEMNNAIKTIQAVVTIAQETIMQDVYVPPYMFETAVVLHGILLNIPENYQKLKDNISLLFETWWSKELQGKEDLTAQTILYLLQKSLEKGATAKDVKRVWKMRACLNHIDLDNQTSETLKVILQNCCVNGLYLKKEEGRKFLSFLFSLNANYIGTIHKAIKTQIPFVLKSVLDSYGEIYFRAWRNASEEYLKKIEQDCIQDLIYYAVHSQRGGTKSLALNIKQILHYFHERKKQMGVDEMLLRLYEPILWRSLKVANGFVRANAAGLLIDVFPLANPGHNAQESDELLQKQLDILDNLLEDPTPLLRYTAIQGIAHICNVFWEVLPATTIKNFVTKLAQDLAWDGASADVRAAVVKGFGHLLDNRLAHPLLKTLLPELINLLHDTSEKVRVAFVDLLLKVKRLRAIQFWSIAPPEHLLARLEVDPPNIAKRIVTLLFSSYMPVDKSSEDQLNRCLTLIKTNATAARKFYQYAAQNHMSVSQTGKFMTIICKCIMLCVKKEQNRNSTEAAERVEGDILESCDEEESQDEEQEQSKNSKNKGRKTKTAEGTSTESTAKSEEDEEDSEDSDNELSLRDQELMANLLETVVILWMTIFTSLKEARYVDVRERLYQRFSVALPQFMRVFHDNRHMSSIIMLAGLLPSNTVPTLRGKLKMRSKLCHILQQSLYNASLYIYSKSMLSKLKGMSPENKADDYSAMLECVCNWGKLDDLLELISEWLEAGLLGHEVEENVVNKSARRKAVAFQEPVEPQPMLALDYLSYLCKDFVCREAVMSKRAAAVGLSKTLKNVLKCVELRLKSEEELSEKATDEFLVKGFEAYLKLEVILHKWENKHNAVVMLKDVILWSDCEVLCIFKIQAKAGGRKKGRRLLGQTETTLLQDASSSQTLAAQTLAGQTLGTTAMTLSETLLSDTVLGKRTQGDSNTAAIHDLATKLLESLLTIASNMLLVGVADHELASHLADFSISMLKLDESTMFLPIIAKLMYQLTELTLTIEHQPKDQGEEISETEDIIPGMLNKVIQMLSTLVKNKKEQAERILPSIKPAFSEVISTYYRHLSLSQAVNKDLIASVMAACVAEMTALIKKDTDFEACSCINELPTLSAFLLGMLQRRKDMTSLFLSELRSCVNSGALNDEHSLSAALHLVHTMSKGRCNTSDMKECLTSIQTQHEQQLLPEEISEDSPIRHLHENNKQLLRNCMNSLGMVA